MRNIKYEDQIAAYLKSQPGVTFYYRDIMKVLDLPESGAGFTRTMKAHPEITRVRRGFYRWDAVGRPPAASCSSSSTRTSRSRSGWLWPRAPTGAATWWCAPHDPA